MKIRLLIGAADDDSLELYATLLNSALDLVPLDVIARHVRGRHEISERVAAGEADVLLLDWSVANGDTCEYVRELLAADRRLRTIIATPLSMRQYRACLWEAGACVGLPKEHLDQEWLLSMLCLITRAMEREDRVRRELAR
jgi:DNA-binding NarL/FixJ family response regulator